MAGISIPIKGNTAGLHAAIRELTAVIRQLSKDINAAFKPAAQAAVQTATATQKVTTEAKKSRRSFVEMGGAVVGVVATVASLTGAVLEVAKYAPTIIRLGRTIRMSLREPIQQAGAEAMSLGARLRALAANPWFRVIAGGAVLAVAGIVGLTVALRTAGFAARTFGGLVNGVFRGVSAAARAAGSVVRGAFAGLRSLIPSFGGGGGMFGGLGGLLGMSAAVALLMSQAKGAFEAAAAYEDLRTRVENFTGSVAKAKSLLGEMAQFADVTPFSTGGMQELLGVLLGSGIKNNVAQIAKDLAAVARTDQQLGELGDALAKGFAKGKFQTEELNKFLERGINLIPQLTAVTGLAGNELTKAIEKGLKFDQVTEAIARMSREGGQFFGMLARQAMTARGLWSTLSSALADLKKSFAMPILDSLKPLLQDAIGLVESLKAKAAAMGKAIGDALLAVFAMVKSGRTMALLDTGLKVAFWGAVDVFMRGLRAATAFLATALPPIFEAATAKLRDPSFWEGIKNVLLGIGHAIAAEILAALGKTDEAALKRGSAELFGEVGANQIKGAGGDVAFSKVFKDSIAEAMKAAGEQLRGPMSYQLREALGWLAILKSSVEREMEELRKKTAVPPPAPGATGQGSGSRMDPVTGIGEMVKQALVLTSSLGRIGGGGFGMTLTPLLAEQKKGNETLRKIEKNTAAMAASGGGATYA